MEELNFYRTTIKVNAFVLVFMIIFSYFSNITKSDCLTIIGAYTVIEIPYTLWFIKSFIKKGELK